jgi:hypothetical protein
LASLQGPNKVGPTGARSARHRATRRLVQHAVESLGLPARCSFDDVLREVERHQGAPLILREAPVNLVQLCGLTLTTDAGVVVHYQPRASDDDQQTVYHELGHIVLGHRINPTAKPIEDSATPTELLAASLLAKLVGSAEAVHADRARTVYDDQEEYEAELFAFLVRARIEKSPSRIVELF